MQLFSGSNLSKKAFQKMSFNFLSMLVGGKVRFGFFIRNNFLYV